MKPRRRRLAVALWSTALVAVAGCGDDDDARSVLSCTDSVGDQVVWQGPDEPQHRMREADLVSAALEITDADLTVTWAMALDVDEALGGAFDLILRDDDRSQWWFRASFAEPGPRLTLHGPESWTHSERVSAGTELAGAPTASGRSVTATFPLDALPDRDSLSLWRTAAHVPHPGIGAVADTCPDGLVSAGSGGTADWLPVQLT